MVEVWRTNKFNSNLLEECVATFNNVGYARKFVDLMAEYESEEMIIKGKERQPLTKEKALEKQFQDKIKALKKDFATVDREKDSFDFER